MTRTRQIWKLRHRWNRLMVRMDESRGEGINIQWLYWSGLSTEVGWALMALGVDIEKPEEEWV